MPSLTEHQSKDTTKLLFIGDSGCLAGDTIISVTRGHSDGKKFTIKEVFEKSRRTIGKRWDKSLSTFLLADIGGHVGCVKMLDIVESGKKVVYAVKAGKHEIKASADHQFKTEQGWQQLKDLKVGDKVYTWRSSRDKILKRRQINASNNIDRVVIYSIPFHPYGQANVVGGKDYKRLPKARLLIEAVMNGLALEEYIRILRTDEEKALGLNYLSNLVDVHHKDGDWTNDALDNLAVIDRAEHIAMHHKEKVQESKALALSAIISIEELKEQQTYDIMMQAPHHNFIANGFVVHNSGKTGSLASLAAAGYNLRILDLDNGLDILKNYLTDPNSIYFKQNPDCAKNVYFKTLTDEMKNLNGKLVPKTATVWTRAIESMMEWKDKSPTGEVMSLGKIVDWGPKDILVIDSLSMLSTAALNFHLSMNGALAANRTSNESRRDIGAAQNLLRDFLNMIFDSSIKCNVILTSHITFVTETGAAPRIDQEATFVATPAQGYPSAIGRALSPHIPRYFNSVLIARTNGTGTGVRHTLYTSAQSIGGQVINAKSSAPLRVKDSYPIETGLADYFKAVRGE